MNTRDIFIIHLSLIEGVGPAAVSKILSHAETTHKEDFYGYTAHDYVQRCGLSISTAQKVVQGLADKVRLDQELRLIEKNNISVVTIMNQQYPELLKNIHLPPSVLYWQGVLPSCQALAVVGSREANAYGSMVVDYIIPQLVAHDFTIISGGARGADTMAHKKALAQGGPTVAVLGSGLLRPYPASNKRLFYEIVERGGALVSPFPVLMEPLPENFPARNRVISGLSRGCIVIQAAAKSGARITADYSLSQGREVFAVPGPLDDPLSAGCHELIKQGAKLVANPADILVELGYDTADQVVVTSNPSKKQWATEPIPAQLAIPVDPLEVVVSNACKEPCSVDELLEATGLPLIQLSSMLFDLQIKGVLTQNMAGLWCRQ